MLALLFTATLLGHPVRPVAATNDGEAIIRALHARYGAVWHRTQTFVQKTTYPDGRVDTWYEAIELPGKLRIDVAPISDGRTILFRNDSIYQFGAGTLRGKRPYVHSMMVLLGDMFVDDPSRTIGRLKALHFDLSKHHESSWDGRPALVIGATVGDTISNQFWLDKERLVVVRMIEKMPDNRRFEAHFSGYQPHGASWVESRIAFFIDGKADQLEEYHDVRTRVTHEPGLFNPDSYLRASWAGEGAKRW
jgi:hypothetical protein